MQKVDLLGISPLRVQQAVVRSKHAVGGQTLMVVRTKRGGDGGVDIRRRDCNATPTMSLTSRGIFSTNVDDVGCVQLSSGRAFVEVHELLAHQSVPFL